MLNLSRRKFLQVAATTASTVVVSSQLTGCVSSGKNTLSDVVFTHGVASGDPSQNAVILWTRAVPKDALQAVSIHYEIATDDGFEVIIRSGKATTSSSTDFTVKIDVTELAADKEYFYRFKGALSVSPIGRTKTISDNQVSRLEFAVFSCANYPAGYFNPYTEAAKNKNLDAVLHLGDYIYEYGDGGYGTENSEKIGRKLPEDNSGELFTLADYRKRYALYRTDSGLQALHAIAPFIVVWDDHEICNDTWLEGAQNHNEGEGDFFERRKAAVQAYYEWLPIRPPKGEQNLEIYRSFDFGQLLSLHMLDTRVIGRDKQIELSEFVDEKTGAFDQAKYVKALSNPNRTLLGKEQKKWLIKSLEQSKAKWQLLGQQILMGKMMFPAEMLLNQDRSKAPKIIGELTELRKKQYNGIPLTQVEQARLNKKIPYNLDAWDGYPAEREYLYGVISKLNKNLVVIAGDTHNGWQNQLTDHRDNLIGMEFATPGVSSPGLETYLNLDEKGAIGLAKAMPVLVDDLQYCNLHQRGFLQLIVTEGSVEAQWLFVDQVSSEEYKVADKKVSSWAGLVE